MSGGFLGNIFTSLSFASALVAAISFFVAALGKQQERTSWQRMGSIAFGTHIVSVIGVIATLFYLIYTHQYQYHYVWSHSSNELPVHFMVSCFWEGQEGSFLLWTFWHAVLGGIILFGKSEWRNVVLAVVASINLILASMILGVYLPEWMGMLLFALAAAGLAAYLLRKLQQKRESLRTGNVAPLMGAALAFLSIVLVLTDNAGFYSSSRVGQFFSLENLAFFGMTLFFLFCLGYIIVQVVFYLQDDTRKRLSRGELFAYMSLLAITFIAMTAEFGTWKIGSSPFLMLREAFPDAPIFASNPDFAPANGNGLNPLLQNYWMVIHPPTLFLGFASTAIPFSFVVGGLLTGKYKEWIRPSAVWAIFSVMILGVGIIMGGYWAYETLNFGGYWNWDPVENSSFVPWLLGIASLHAMVAYRRSKQFLRWTMLLTMSTFIFVLYSTFLTRSGILGETSVHTFTDLGLSGQLLLLLFFYIFAIVAMYVGRVKEIPQASKTIATNSAEFVVFLGVLTLLFAGIVITIFTSIPVFNAILGTNWATPTDGPFFYYRWTIWFAIALAVVSGIGQYLYWRRVAKQKVSNALMRPYVLAITIAAVIIVSIVMFTNWEFGFDQRYREWKELADLSSNFFMTIFRYIRLGFFVFADEIMLFAALFMVFANVDILIHLLRKNQRTRQVTGGSIAHLGFGLMLLGFLFSSGYDQVISKNVNPRELAALEADARVDNVLLQKNRPRNIVGYEVTYTGKKEAQAPVSDVTVINDDDESFKVRFLDATGDVFAFVMPREVFVDQKDVINMPYVEQFLNEKLEFLKPKHINERTLYGLKFVPRKRNRSTGETFLQPEKAFTLYPEAEVNPRMGLIAHPSRKILADADIYVHVSTIPREEEEPQFEFYNEQITVGDTIKTKRSMFVLSQITSEPVKGTDYALIAKAHLEVINDFGMDIKAEPQYVIDAKNRVSVQDDYLDDIYTVVSFTGVDTEAGLINIRIQEQTNPPDDIVVIQALKKPFINILWLGTFVLTFGFIMAMVRRIKENRNQVSAVPEYEKQDPAEAASDAEADPETETA